MTNGGSRDDRTLGQTGEFAVIDVVTAHRGQPSNVLLGPGDDAALVAAPDGTIAISTDMLIENRHFRLDWSSPQDIGRKAIAQNAADIEAMGAAATAFVVAFGAPPDTPLRNAADLSDGLWAEATRLGAGIVGGDMVASDRWVISVTVLGDLAGRPAVRRDGAEPGSVVAVTGTLGASAAGYALLLAGSTAAPVLRRRHLVPQPPYGQGRKANDAGATAMTDVSDGLLADLGHIASASMVGIELDSAALTADIEALAPAAAELGVDATQWVLTGGEDHALVACFPAQVPPGWRVIGRVIERDGRDGAVRVDGRAPSGYTGWQSFG